ncbi:hypothetical protein [Agarivorans litoreus]|uniref:hypothetical protein n=1 Tax=Agarivorans litoreus TaxID=1510455 RepID=UPI001C7CE235|nr:hypothetical protein [Agarivorans litoreus]
MLAFALLGLGISYYLISSDFYVAAVPIIGGIFLAEWFRIFERAALAEHQSFTLSVSSDGLKYCNSKTGYDITRPLSAVKHVRASMFLAVPVVTVDFINNERLRFICYTNSDELATRLSPSDASEI